MSLIKEQWYVGRHIPYNGTIRDSSSPHAIEGRFSFIIESNVTEGACHLWWNPMLLEEHIHYGKKNVLLKEDIVYTGTSFIDGTCRLWRNLMLLKEHMPFERRSGYWVKHPSWRNVVLQKDHIFCVGAWCCWGNTLSIKKHHEGTHYLLRVIVLLKEPIFYEGSSCT